MPSNLEDRPYQVAAAGKAVELLKAGRHTCLVSPTGSGKSVMAELVVRSLPGRWAVMTHREEIAEQLQDRFPDLPILSWQGQASGRAKHTDVQYLFIDECHHAGSDGPWGEAVREDFPNAVRFGATATPQRGDRRPLGNTFQELVVAANYSELLARDWLTPCRVFRPSEELSGLAKRPVDEYLLRTPGEQAICFVGSKAEAIQVVQEFRDAGVPCRSVLGEHPEDHRREVMAWFREGRLKVLVNIFVATEGFDVPECSVCIIARGCEAEGTYLQMVGRALRPALGKVCAYLLDLRGVSHRLGLPTQDRGYSLDGKAISTTAPLRLCPACGWCYEPGPVACPSCGYNMTAAERKQAVLNETTEEATEKLPADLEELERLTTLANSKGWSADWAVRAYRKTHIRPVEWPSQTYSAIYNSLRKQGVPRVQAHARTKKTLT